jgi:hypothetical protein
VLNASRPRHGAGRGVGPGRIDGPRTAPGASQRSVRRPTNTTAKVARIRDAATPRVDVLSQFRGCGARTVIFGSGTPGRPLP